jgi:Ca2+-binding EF-hand superfamily protein
MDKTGRINYLEFLAATVPNQVLQDTARLRQAFDRLDADSSGFISKKNLKELMGSDYDEHSVAEMIASADIKNNGRIDFEEFLELMQDSKGDEARAANVVVEMPSVEDEG